MLVGATSTCENCNQPSPENSAFSLLKRTRSDGRSFQPRRRVVWAPVFGSVSTTTCWFGNRDWSCSRISPNAGPSFGSMSKYCVNSVGIIHVVESVVRIPGRSTPGENSTSCGRASFHIRYVRMP